MTTATYRNYSGRAAELYQSFFVPSIATPVSAELLRVASVQPGERVLDLACGTGIIARAAAEQAGPGGSVTGIDVAADMIAVARSTTSAGASIEWHGADAAALRLADDAYDVVLCQMGLMFIEDRVGALAEAHRVLAPGGRIVLNTPGRIHAVFAAMEHAIVTHIDPQLGAFVHAVFSMHDPDELGALLRDAGFSDVSSNEYTATLDLPAPAEFLWNYINLTPMAPLVAQAPAKTQAAMEREMVEASAPSVVTGRTRVVQPMALARGVNRDRGDTSIMPGVSDVTLAGAGLPPTSLRESVRARTDPRTGVGEHAPDRRDLLSGRRPVDRQGSEALDHRHHLDRVDVHSRR